VSKKDDADRRAEELVTLRTLEEDNGHKFQSLMIGSHGAGGTWTGEKDSALIRDAIASAIRAAVAEAEEHGNRILTDMLSEGEAAQEMWRIAANAACARICRELSKYNLAAVHTVIPHIANLEMPQPPSHNHLGEPLRPSRVALERDRYRRALEDAAQMIRGPSSNLHHRVSIRISEALEDT
jgi:hypothetical protein